MPTASASLPVDFACVEGLLQTVLDISLTAIQLWRPLSGAAEGGLSDFRLEYLNPAARHLPDLPARAGSSLRTSFPHPLSSGLFDFCRRVFETGEADSYDIDYPPNGPGNGYHLAARRHGPLLIVSVTVPVDHARPAGELPLRESPIRESPTHRLAEEGEKLRRIFAQTPAAICIQRGPEHRYEYCNPAYQQLFPDRELYDRTVAEALPETVEAGIVDLLDNVYQTGITYFGHELPLLVAQPAGRPPRQMYFTCTYQAYREDGQIVGVATFAHDVSGQVQARREREGHYRQLHELFEQAPVGIAVFRGPQYVVEMANPVVCAMWGRTPAQALHTPLFELLPEAANQGLERLLDGVMATGTPYVAHELPALIDHQGHRDTVYWDFVYNPLREADGRITGITVVATEVSEQVQIRLEVQGLNEELSATNEELQVANEEGLANNAELQYSQQQLLILTQELEARVADRTTQLQSARADTERQRARLERLFMAAPAAICILDGPELVFELVNPIYQQWFPGRALLGHPLLEALPELAGHAVLELLHQVYQTGVTHDEPAMLVPVASPATGRLEDRYFNLVYQARLDKHGRTDGLLVFAFEVSEQVSAKQASEANAKQLRLITDALPVLIGYLDQDQKYRFANRAYETWFNQNAADLLGRPVRDVVGEPAYLGMQHYIERALAGEQVDFEARMPYRPGVVKHIRTSFIPDVQHGRVAGFYSLVTDVTEQVLARQQVQNLNRQLAASNDKLYAANAALGDANQELGDTNQQLTRTNVDLDTFVYSASHDLKDPINNIEGLLHALGDELPLPGRLGDVSYILKLMQDAVDRFKHTIESLADISRLQQEHGQLAPPVRLPDVIRDVRLDLAPLIQAAGARLYVNVEACPVLMFSDKNLRSVVYNLLSNALKYRHPDRVPHISLQARVEERYLVLMVQDNGLGLDITPERPLFDLFRRYHTHVAGSGVGLYMVKKMVENVGGKIEVESKLGLGSTFSVYFKR
ncbi:PAS domain-containing protein [Hymenobacter fastidiosus]